MAIEEMPEENYPPFVKRFTDCDNCQKPLTECACGDSQMPVCNYCGKAQIDCRCDEDSYSDEF